MSSPRRRAARAGRASGPPTLEQLEFEVPALEERAEEIGAPAIPQESSGFVTRLFDILNRPVFAVAGAIEEAVSPPKRVEDLEIFGRVLKRAGRELFSGVAGLKGEKRLFGEVLEKVGVPAGPTLSEMIPFAFNETGEGLALKRGGALDITTRGVVGTALDIASDPITYVSFGTSRLGVKAGEKVLSRTGKSMLRREIEEMLPRGANGYLNLRAAPAFVREAANKVVRESPEIVDDSVRAAVNLTGAAPGTAAFDAANRAAHKAAEARVLAAAATDASLLDRGGIKWMGMTIPGTPRVATISSNVSAGVIEAVGRTQSGAAALEAVRSTRDAFGALFNRDYLTRAIPGYNRWKQARMDAEAALNAALKDDARKSALSRVKPTEWKRIIDTYEKDGLDALKGVEREAMQAYKDITDRMFAEEVKRGLIDPEDYIQWYFAHFYENSPDEIQTALRFWKIRGANLESMGRHSAERHFQRLAQAEKVTKALNAIDSRVPVLRPIYDPSVSLGKRIDAHTQKVLAHDFLERLKAEGLAVPTAVEIEKLIDLSREAWPGKLTAGQTREYVGIIEELSKRKMPRPSFLEGLSSEGRREALRQAALRIKTRDDIFKFIGRYEKFLDDVPGAPEMARFISSEGTPYARLTGIKGLENYDLPREIADDLIRTYSFKEPSPMVDAAKTILRGYDRLHKWFKVAVTLPFPAFTVRNKLGDTAQALADVGISAINPKLHWDTVQILAGAQGTFRTKIGTEYSYDTLRAWIKGHQIRVTGLQALEVDPAVSSRVAEKMLSMHGWIETESRAQLFLNYIRRGFDPETAAERMKDVLFDYNNLSVAEKQVMRRLIPFYVWTRKNIQRQVHLLRTKPGVFSMQAKAFTPRISETESMTMFESESLQVRMNRDGNSLTVIQGVDLPVKSLDLIWKGSLSRTFREQFGLLSPFLRTPAEAAFRARAFTGIPFRREESQVLGKLAETAMPQFARKWMGYKKVVTEAGPKYTFDSERMNLLVRSFILSRFASTSDRVFKILSDDRKMAPALLWGLTSLQFKELDLTEGQRRRLAERKRQIEENMVRWGDMKEFPVRYRDGETGER